MRNCLKKLAVCLPVLLALAGCSKMPKEVDGHPVHEVPFSQPLILTPETGQDFYFYFKEKGKELQTDYLIGVTFLIPADDDKLIEAEKAWSSVDYENKTPGKDNLHFDVKLEYHNKQGQVIPIPLKNSLGKQEIRQGNAQWYRLWSNSYAISGRGKIIEGRLMTGFQREIANFMPANVSDQPDGYYKLSIRPAAGVQYPNIHFETFVEYEFHK